MGFIDKVKEKIPAHVRPFLIRGIILVVVWELLYNFVLKPTGIPDDQLTRLVQLGAMELLSWFYTSVTDYGNKIIIDGNLAVGIAHQCNGLELIALYIGFILCIPTSLKRMLAFITLGTIAICILNVIRTALLAAMYNHDHSLTDFAHHYVFKIIIYAAVFGGWVLYVKKPRKHETHN